MTKSMKAVAGIASAALLAGMNGATAQWIFPEGPGVKSSSQARAVEADGAPSPDLPEGWRWVVPVRPFSLESARHPNAWQAASFEGGAMRAITREGRPLEVMVWSAAGSSDSIAERVSFRVFLLDEAADNIGHNGKSSLRTDEAAMISFHWEDPTRLSGARWIGLAMLDYEGRAERAQNHREASEATGLRFPELPRVGEPFEFELKTLDGTRVTHEDFLGKVVIFDAWATWCGPCMQKMPEMRKLRDMYADRGVEIVGISMERYADDAAQRAKRAIERHELDWIHIDGSPSLEARRMWYNITGIESLPRMFIVDRNGVLRKDQYPGYWLPEFLDDLLEEQPPQAAAGD